MTFRHIIFSLFCFSYVPLSIADTKPRPHPNFIKAIHAAKLGELQKAKELFEKSRLENYKNPKLFYNLGVVYYKLKMYPKAKNEFSHLTKNKSLNELAFYNLALIEIKLNNEQEAMYWLNQIIKRNNRSKIREMALSLMQKMKGSQNQVYPGKQQYADKKNLVFAFNKQPTFKSSIKTEFGYNDNIAQYRYITDINKTTSGDNFLFVQANSQIKLNQHINFFASTFYMAYQEKTYFNSISLLANTNYHNQLSHWQYEIGSSYIRQTSNGTEYQEIIRFDLSLLKYLFKELKYSTYVKSDFIRILDESYEHLDGNQVSWKQKFDFFHHLATYSFSYRYEYNSRRDFQSNDGISFTSFSPRIHKTEISISPIINQTLKAGIFAGIAYQYHNKNNVISNDNYILRKDFKYQYGFSVNYQLRKHLGLSGKYRYSNNQSTLIIYNYDNSLYQFGVDWDF